MKDTIETLTARIDDLKTYCRHLHTIVISILDQAPHPPGINYALFALACGFTSAQEEVIMDFIHWAYYDHGVDALTRERVFAEWQARAPDPLRDKLDAILKAQVADGACQELARIALPPNPDDGSG